MILEYEKLSSELDQNGSGKRGHRAEHCLEPEKCEGSAHR